MMVIVQSQVGLVIAAASAKVMPTVLLIRSAVVMAVDIAARLQLQPLILCPQQLLVRQACYGFLKYKYAYIHKVCGLILSHLSISFMFSV